MFMETNNLYKLKNLGYKYYGFDKITSQIINKIPNCISPNIITILGFVFSFIGFICSVYLHNQLITCISIFLYIILNNLNGIHTQIIKRSSAIGELLDHSLDSVSNTFVTISYCYLGKVYVSTTFLITQIMNILFYFSYIRAYYNDLLIIPKFRPIESFLIINIMIYLVNLFNIDINYFLSYYFVLFIYYSLIAFVTLLLFNPIFFKYNQYYMKNMKNTINANNNYVFKERNIRKLKILIPSMLVAPILYHYTLSNSIANQPFIYQNYANIVYYSQIYSMLTTDTILSKILSMNLSNEIIKLSILLILCVDFPVVISITFSCYYIYIIYTLSSLSSAKV